MRNMFRRGLSWILVLVMLVGLLPVSVFASVNSSGKPTDLENTLVLSIYTPEGSFPGEPAMHGSEDYISFNSSFAKTTASGKFKDNAKGELKTSILDDLVQGASSGKSTVWGVFSAEGLKETYFESGASIIQPANEAKIIRVIKGNAVKNLSDAEILNKYEIIWYVIKLQHSPGSGFFNRGTTEWHIDGLIREKSEEFVSVNYYGNGNTEGAAPDGITNHLAGTDYTVLGSSNMKKKIKGVYVDFLGWSAKADGTGEEAGFYKAGDVIQGLNKNISLYAMWDTTTQYTATVNTYLDGILTDESDIHGSSVDLHLGTEGHYYQLTRSKEGVYTVKITGNGKFHLFNKNSDGTYTQIGTHQLTIYNQNGSLDVHHYSVTYDANGGDFAADPGKQAYYYGETVTAVTEEPTRDGYQFQGWINDNGYLVMPGERVTASIDSPITLTAQWEKTVKVTVNVTINHNESGGGHDNVADKRDVQLDLVSRESSTGPYLEVEGQTLKFSESSHEGCSYTGTDEQTKYTGYVIQDMPGGSAEYTVVTSKSGYETKITPTKGSDGNWIIDVEMTYKPSNFDVEFTVNVDKEVPDNYIPDAAIVKVTYWSKVENKWMTITQQDGSKPGVRVNIDPNTRSGSGSYPVWKYESNSVTPYGYRIEVTSFIYPDGTIVPASKVVKQDEAWTDGVYTATVDPVNGGRLYGSLSGAYYDDTAKSQKGTLNAVISMKLYDVTFDAQGGKVNGLASQKVEDQYKIPAFKNYTPVRGDGYTFDGWYEDQEFTKAAAEGKILTDNVTLYAKWIEPRTISGTVTISGTYMQNGKKVSVHDIDRATEAAVVLQEVRNGHVYDVDSVNVSFGKYNDTKSVDYSFSGLPNDGKQYQIHVLLLNYGTAYDNESDIDNEFTSEEYAAVFGDDNTADVDAYLEFVPPAYTAKMSVDATQISADFRPEKVLSEVMYRDTGDNHAFQRISQHDVSPFGVNIELNDGKGQGSQSIWKWHTNGTLYDYQMNITKLYGNVSGVFSSTGTAFNSDTAPYYIVYDEPVYWNSNTGSSSGVMKATLIPKQYPVIFNLNADGDTVTGMESYKLTYQDANGNDVVTDDYGVIHTWSYDTEITAVPQREGYVFEGWEANVSYADNKIDASIHQNVVLTAIWRPVAVTEEKYTVSVSATTGGTAAIEGTVDLSKEYKNGETATVIATIEGDYLFNGWYEDGELVSTDLTYSFTVTEDRTLKAKFSKFHVITVIADPEEGGTVSGGGEYAPRENATIKADADDDYYFVGWYDEDDELITANTSYSLMVTENRTFTAKFEKQIAYQCDYVYLFGYSNREIGARGPLLRGELSQMIYRLVKQNTGADNGGHSFDDTDGEWFESGVSYMAEIGAINKSKSNAYPFASVTRGETYKMICLGLEFTSDTELSFSEYAAILRNSGYLKDDGRVTAKIKRWEFCELFNAILGRSDYELEDAEGNEITAEDYGYEDLKPSDPYYEIMMIATSTFTDGKVDMEGRMERNTYDYEN